MIYQIACKLYKFILNWNGILNKLKFCKFSQKIQQIKKYFLWKGDMNIAMYKLILILI